MKDGGDAHVQHAHAVSSTARIRARRRFGEEGRGGRHAVERHGEPDIRMASTGLRAEGAGVGAGKGQSREATGYTR